MPENLEPLFPEMPEDLSSLSEEARSELLTQHETAAKLIQSDDENFLAGYKPSDLIDEYKRGAEQIKAILAFNDGVAEEREAALKQAGELMKDAFAVAEKEEEEPAPDDDSGDEDDGAVAEEPTEVVAEAAEEVAVVASTEKPKPPLPKPSADHTVTDETPEREVLSFTASAFNPRTPVGAKLETVGEIAEAARVLISTIGRPSKHAGGTEERYPVARLDYSARFPEDWTLPSKDIALSYRRIAKTGSPFFGREAEKALLAAGNVLCAPLEPRYDMPALFTDARPVRDALPSFRAQRGGINVPTPTTIGDASGAISVIDQADEELGGTFNTKACLDMDCPAYTETAVTTISHCRQFGNIQAAAWPEKIEHELALTMAEHSRAAEMYLLERIKAQSINVTSGATTLGALIYLVDAITKSAWGIRGRNRMPLGTRFTALLPGVVLDMLVLDAIQNQFDRYKTRGDVDAYLRSIGIDPVYYLDGDFAAGNDMIPTSSQSAGALTAFPGTFQWALFPAGTFLHIDMADLNLGIVRDSTLNAENEFEVFGESFENVALIGPANAAYWETTTICPTGEFPPAGTARDCP